MWSFARSVDRNIAHGYADAIPALDLRRPAEDATRTVLGFDQGAGIDIGVGLDKNLLHCTV